MTRKDYIVFANVLKDIRPEDQNLVNYWELVVARITTVFGQDNERFNADKFDKKVRETK